MEDTDLLDTLKHEKIQHVLRNMGINRSFLCPPCLTVGVFFLCVTELIRKVLIPVLDYGKCIWDNFSV